MPERGDDRAVRRLCREFLSRELLCNAADHLRTLRRVENVPHLGLARVTLHTARIIVVRMHLHGEVLRGVDELNEDRHVRASARACAERRRMIRKPRGERLARRRTARNAAEPVRMRRELPALRRDARAAVLAQLVMQPMPAPKIVLEHGRKFHYMRQISCTPFRLSHYPKYSRKKQADVLFHLTKTARFDRVALY